MISSIVLFSRQTVLWLRGVFEESFCVKAALDNLITHSHCTSIFKYVLWWAVLDCVMRTEDQFLRCRLFRPLVSVRRNHYANLGNSFSVTQLAMKDRVVCGDIKAHTKDWDWFGHFFFFFPAASLLNRQNLPLEMGQHVMTNKEHFVKLEMLSRCRKIWEGAAEQLVLCKIWEGLHN